MKVTNEEIQKALDVLGLGETNTESFEKAKTSEKEVEKMEEEKTEEVEKGCNNDMKKSEEDDKEEEKKEDEEDKSELEKSENDTLSKSEEPTISKAEIEEIVKSNTQSLESKFDALLTLQKANIETIETLTSKINDFDKRSAAPKSFTSQDYIQREFEKATSEGKKVLVLGKDNKEIKEILKAKSGVDTGNINESWANALMNYEATGIIGSDAKHEILKSDDIVIL